jgi:hypothetical protein
MNIVERAKQIILKPKDEWVVIDQETTSVQELVTKYLIPLALIPAIASFIGYAFMSKIHGFGMGIGYGIVNFVVFIGGALISAWILDALAPSFGSSRDYRKAMQLVTYSYTPMIVAAVVLLIPSLGWIMMLAGIYSLYVLYLGFKPMMKTPDDKVSIYFIVSLVVMVVVYLILYRVLGRIIVGNPIA